MVSPTLEHFSYHSTQRHTTQRNGKVFNRKNTVNIKNGQGTKEVEITEGSKTRKYQKKLTAEEIQKIRGFVFVPKLFEDCKSPECESRQRNKTTRKNRRN